MENLTGMNKYIGMRYVPLLDGDWLEGVPYEPLTIVTYQGNSYTSRTFVPAGIPPTNDEYWALTGNYNAQVEAYRKEVEELKEQVANINTKKYLLIGDEYMVGVNGSQPPTNSFAKLWKNNGLNCDIVCKKGAGFKGAGVTFYDLISGYTGDRSKITNICIFGGVNDLTITENEFGKAANVIRQYVIKEFPNAKIYLFMISINWLSTDKEKYLNLMTIYETCGLYDFTYIFNASEALHFKAFLDQTNSFPNQFGQNSLAKYLYGCLDGGTVSVNFPTITYRTIPAPDTGITIPVDLHESLSNGMLNFGVNSRFQINLENYGTAPIDWTNTSIFIGSITANTYHCPYNGAKAVIPVLARYTGEEGFRTIPATISLIGTGVFLMMQPITDKTTPYQGKMNYIAIPPFNINCPSSLC